MALLEGQADINGLVVGPGTPYELVGFNPWRRQVRADQSRPRAWSHGNWSGAEWREQIVVDIELHYGAPTTAEWKQLNDAATAAFAPVGEDTVERELRFTRGGREYLVRGRPRVFEPETRPGAKRSFAIATFAGLDPFLYSSDELVATVTLPTYTGGLTLPIYLPLRTHGVKVGGETLAVNDGTADTALRLRIDGPAVAPKVTVQRQDGTVETLAVRFDIPPGHWLDIDTGSHAVLLNGTANRRGQVSGDFPLLPNGTSKIAFTSNVFDEAALLTARWRHAWW